MEVRTRHCTAARKARKAGFGLLVPEKLGLSGFPEEKEGFIHFWRTVGHLLGIEDRSGISVTARNSSTTWVFKLLMAKGRSGHCGLVCRPLVET